MDALQTFIVYDRASSFPRISESLWAKYGHEVNYGRFSSFFLCLASGNLKEELFRLFLVQGYAISAAMEMSCDVASDLITHFDSSRSLFLEFSQVFGTIHASYDAVLKGNFIRFSDNALLRSTKRYIEFVMVNRATDIKQPIRKKLNIFICQLAACFRTLNYFIEEYQRVHIDNFKKVPNYQHIIKDQLLDSVKELCDKVDKQLNVALASSSKKEIQYLESIYLHSIRLFAAIFVQSGQGHQSFSPLRHSLRSGFPCLKVFSNYDFTCTQNSSADMLVEYGIHFAADRYSWSQTQKNRALFLASDRASTWTILKEDSEKKILDTLERVFPAANVDRYRLEHIVDALGRLSVLFKEISTPVVESGILSNLDPFDVEQVGKCILLQQGCYEFFSALTSMENVVAELYIVSRSWSTKLIKSSLSSVTNATVYGNEILYHNHRFRGIRVSVATPLDKLFLLRKMMFQDDFQDRRVLSLYIGHGICDLPCLLEADIGIIFNCRPHLRTFASRFGVCIKPLFDGLVEKQWKGFNQDLSNLAEKCHSNRGKGVLFEVNSWAEIHAFVLGADYMPVLGFRNF